MTEIEKTPQEPIKSFPKSLADLKLPTLKEAQQIVREGEGMMRQMTEKRKREGKLLPHDPEMFTIVVYSGPSRPAAPNPAPVIK